MWTKLLEYRWFRQFLGLLPFVYHCSSCTWPAPYPSGLHITCNPDGTGSFPLCRYCWMELRPVVILTHYRRAYRWKKSHLEGILAELLSKKTA